MVVDICFSATNLILCVLYVFASSAPFYTAFSHTHFVEFHSLDSFLNKKIKINLHPLYSMHLVIEMPSQNHPKNQNIKCYKIEIFKKTNAYAIILFK